MEKKIGEALIETAIKLIRQYDLFVYTHTSYFFSQEVWKAMETCPLSQELNKVGVPVAFDLMQNPHKYISTSQEVIHTFFKKVNDCVEYIKEIEADSLTTEQKHFIKQLMGEKKIYEVKILLESQSVIL